MDGAALRRALARFDSWASFDVFALAAASHNRPLEAAALEALARLGLLSTSSGSGSSSGAATIGGGDGASGFAVPEAEARAYFRAAEAGYAAANPYHTATHAADVVQTAAAALLGADGLAAALAPGEALAVVWAAAVHDVGHRGEWQRGLLWGCGVGCSWGKSFEAGAWGMQGRQGARPKPPNRPKPTQNTTQPIPGPKKKQQQASATSSS